MSHDDISKHSRFSHSPQITVLYNKVVPAHPQTRVTNAQNAPRVEVPARPIETAAKASTAKKRNIWERCSRRDATNAADSEDREEVNV